MIHTELNREDALVLLQMGKDLFDESHFSEDETFNPQRVWTIFELTLKMPNKFFICYDKTEDGIIRGGFLAQATTHYFSDELFATDMAVFIRPEYRGSTTFFKLLRAAETWARQIGAGKFRLSHNTGINTESGLRTFERAGYKRDGYILTKELD